MSSGLEDGLMEIENIVSRLRIVTTRIKSIVSSLRSVATQLQPPVNINNLIGPISIDFGENNYRENTCEYKIRGDNTG